MRAPEEPSVNRKTVDRVNVHPGGVGPAGAQGVGFHALAINGRRLRRVRFVNGIANRN